MDPLVRRVSVLCLAAVVSACGTGNDGEVSSDIEAAASKLGESASNALTGALVTQLTAAMQEGGPVHAIEFCSTSALELTAGIAREQGLEVKRTSMKYRNPANAPDQSETEALKYFESLLAETGALPTGWVQKAGRDEYRYYRPLTVAPPCLHCHGTSENIAPSVQAVLEERYPDDLATDYALGDFRGLVRVSIPADRLDEPED